MLFPSLFYFLNRFGKDVKIVHFLGSKKPWMYSYNRSSGTVESTDGNHSYEHLKMWWNIYTQHVGVDEYVNVS